MRLWLGISGLVLVLAACRSKHTERFHLLDASRTGIDFINTIVENDTVNVFQYMNVYTGAGVAVGDINNDGLTDIYFSGNMVSGRLYLNRGDMRFEDITEKAGLLNHSWGTGATMVDIDQDGFLDIYVAVSGGAPEPQRANLLYRNNGDMTFTEKAHEYGLDDTRQSMHSAFFDYDKDGDLDMYLLVNPAAYEHQVNTSNPRKLDGSAISNDRLYRNDNGTFTDVSLESGIVVEGYGLGVGISDINDDGWPDIYVSNDFIGNDILYINQGNGTFKDEIGSYIDHTSYAGMGNAITDIDNNGKPDIMVLDMRPEDNLRQKMIISSTGYDRFQMMLQAGYQPQYSRNTLQLNLGQGQFAEIGNMAGISSTDWSWSSLFGDFDNDGHKDLYVTNGFLRDLGDLDYIHYQGIYDNPLGEREVKKRQKLNSIKELPPAKLNNYLYRNRGDNTFEKVSERWGIEHPSCSNGASYADLDNDGDLDLIVNNVDQPAFIYENDAGEEETNNYLQISLEGTEKNRRAIGAKIKLTTKDGTQHEQHFLSRGYESSIDPVLHFGLGQEEEVERIEVWWPNDRYQAINGVKSNQRLTIAYADGATRFTPDSTGHEPYLVSADMKIDSVFRHSEDHMVDFKLQPILPHMHSRSGPGIAVADVNGDELEDFYIGGAAGQSGGLYLQNEKGDFRLSAWKSDPQYEDMGCLFLDVNTDGYPDLYVVSGGIQLAENGVYQDRLYLNDGQGNFSRSNALPKITTSGSTVNAADFDRDGDLDLFVGGRVNPGNYPMPAKSYLLENLTDEHTKSPQFKDVSSTVEGWEALTMVSSALWSDYDGDGWVDLIVVGEFMKIEFFHNEMGKLVRATSTTGLQKTEGWWNSINAGDFDGDGDIDYVVGNLGKNHKYYASADHPLCIYAKDYDKDGNVDPVMCFYNGDDTYIAHSRDELISQISAMRSRFKTYRSFAETSFENSFLPEELDNAYVVKSHKFASSHLENLGDGTFKISDLPQEAQVAPVEGIVVLDLDHDGFEDLLLTGNSYSTEVATGRYDALKGLLLQGRGNGSFKTISLEESGFINDGDASGLAILNNDGRFQVVVANNDAALKAFTINPREVVGFIFPDEETQYADIYLKNGKRIRKEFYFGTGYLSQSSRGIALHSGIREIKFTNTTGQTQTVYRENEVQ